MRAPQHSLAQTARQTARARAAFVEIRGQADAVVRAQQIAALPTVVWRGHTLYTLRCDGGYGRGPHQLNVREQVLWSLMTLGVFHCPFHR